MRKFILCFPLLLGFIAKSQDSVDVWQSKFYTIDNFLMDMSLYKEKPIAFLLIDANNPDLQMISLLDSINRQSDNQLIIIGIAIDDSDDSLSASSSLIQALRSGTGVSFPVTTPTKSTDDSLTKRRHVLIDWLEENPANNHFRIDFSQHNQILVVDRKGTLFAVLADDNVFSKPVWDDILERSLLDH